MFLIYSLKPTDTTDNPRSAHLMSGRRNSAQLLLEMLSSQSNKPALSEAMVDQGLHRLLIRCARADNSLDLQRTCLRILLKNLEQPTRRSSIMIADVCYLLSEGITCCLRNYSGEGSANIVETLLHLLYASGATWPVQLLACFVCPKPMC